jgi:iron complex outermembrane receptor protein
MKRKYSSARYLWQGGAFATYFFGSGLTPAIAEEGVAAGAQMEEVIVTARRREENQQDVPIAITAFTEQALSEKAITNGYELQRASPSLVASTSGNRADGLTYSMRGQSNIYGSGGASVIVYFADVPQSAGYAGAPFFDLASVQVLAGPQGTLFGQSSTGGAVLFAPRRPTKNFDGYVTAGAGNLNYRKMEGAINIPISESLSVRLAGNVLRRNGFTHDVTYNMDEDDQHEENWRAGVLWTPSGWFENYLVADGRNVNVNGTAYSLYQIFGPGLILPDGSFTQALADQQARGARKIANSSSGPPPSQKIKNWGLSNTSKFDLGAVTIKNILGYRKVFGEGSNTQDGDGSPLPLLTVYPAGSLSAAPPGFENTPANAYTISNEVQILGKAFDDRLDWIVGGFYSHYNSGKTQQNFGVTSPTYSFLCTAPTPFDPCPNPSPPFTPADPPASTAFTGGTLYGGVSTRTSKASFVQGTFKVTDALNFTAGYRYSKDESASAAGFFAVNTPFGTLLFPSAPSSYESHGSSWNLSFDYKLTDKLLVYLASRRGYKAGQPAPNLYPGDVGHYVASPIKPEAVTDFEIGLKKDWSTGDLSGRFNAAAYYSDYQNIQRQIASAYTSAPLGFNVDKANILGLELVGSIAYESFSLDASYAYTDAKYKEFINPFPGPGQSTDASNNPFGFVPKNKFNVSAHYDFALGGDAGRIVPSVGYSWQSEFFYTEQAFNFPGAVVPSHGLVNARIDWSGVFGSKLTVALFGDNLTDKEYIENGNLDAAEVGRVFYGAPRTYGLEANYRF